MISDLETILGSEPSLQALFEATRRAETGPQSDLLEAVLTDDHRAVRRLLEEEDHGRLLNDSFFLPLAVILATQTDPSVLRVMAEHGYNAKTQIANQGTQRNDVSIGELAISLGSLERHRELVDAGFLAPAKWAYSGMGRADPALFDYWNQLYWENPRQNAKALNMAALRWISPAHSGRTPKRTQAQRAEFARRLDCQIQSFLEYEYPASSPAEQWRQVLTHPFDAHSGSGVRDFEGDRLSSLILKQILKGDTSLRSQTLPVVDVSVRRGENIALALLNTGFSLADFGQDLVSDILERMLKVVDRNKGATMPESANRLWRRVVRELEKDNSPRLAQLPPEILGGAGLNALLEGKRDERVARLQMLRMFIDTPVTAPAPGRKGPGRL